MLRRFTSGSVSVIVQPPPSVSVAGASTLCSGSSATLAAGGAASYTWNNAATTSTINISPLISTVYSVTGMNSKGCSGINSHTVTVYPKPAVSINAIENICKGKSIVLTAAGASTYLWNNNATTNSISVSPIVTAIYSVIGTNSQGCASVAVATIQVLDCTTIEEITTRAPQIKVYPSVFKDLLTIEVITAGNQQHEIVINNMLGDTVCKLISDATTQDHKIDLSFLPAGIYYLFLKESPTIKLIKDK